MCNEMRQLSLCIGRFIAHSQQQITHHVGDCCDIAAGLHYQENAQNHNLNNHYSIAGNTAKGGWMIFQN